MVNKKQDIYSIPARYRRLENLHIVFWLFKDISWCMLWKLLGIIMIVPTLSVAIYISYRTRRIKSELAHNLAVAFWISANSYWMISEFFGFDEVQIFNDYEGKHLAMIPFLIGIIILAWYYLVERRKEVNKDELVTM
ncbi:MAG TPA: hypothetical protein VFP97_00185 [Chitinophagaceae bacterium]|nr:hypothetical protein [Chitinophagaceae bacterium]